MTILPLSYFQKHDVLFVSQNLLGKYLMTSIDSTITGGMIVETEAYRAPEDRASHAYNYKRTKRNEVMYHAGGTCYVYQCYGIHSLFNVITGEIDVPHGVLIRAIEPKVGIEAMLKRRDKEQIEKSLTSGPGNLTKALGINKMHKGLTLSGPPIWIEDRGVRIPKAQIISSKRIGVDYAGEDALLMWRFYIKDNPWITKK